MDFDSLCLILNSHQLAAKLLLKASMLGHIEWLQYPSENFNLFYFTSKGLAYLRDVQSLLPLRIFSSKNMDIKIYPKSERGREKREKIANTNAAIALAYRAGCKITPDSVLLRLVPEIPESGMFLRAYLAEHFSQDEKFSRLGLFPETQQQSDLIFHSGCNVKSVAGTGNHMLSFSDFITGRYRGVIDSPYRSALIYVSRSGAMLWGENTVKNELAAYKQWTNRRQDISRNTLINSGSSAFLLVYRPEDFARMYSAKSSHGVKQNFGGLFKHFYILPSGINGARQLRSLMLSSTDQKLLKYYEKRILQTGAADPNPRHISLFPLISKDGNPAALGFCLDAKMMKDVETVARLKSMESFEVFCWDWQEDYFRLVMPENVKIFTFSPGS